MDDEENWRPSLSEIRNAEVFVLPERAFDLNISAAGRPFARTSLLRAMPSRGPRSLRFSSWCEANTPPLVGIAVVVAYRTPGPGGAAHPADAGGVYRRPIAREHSDAPLRWCDNAFAINALGFPS
jgi:hypothetical protein